MSSQQDPPKAEAPLTDTGWIPEMLLSDSVFRIERARRNLLRAVKRLSGPNSWFTRNPETILLFERVVQERKRKRHETAVNFVHFKPYEDKPYEESVDKLIGDNRAKITDWIASTKREVNGAFAAGQGGRREFYELVKLKSRIPVHGFLSAILTRNFFDANGRRPVAYLGTIGGGEQRLVSAKGISYDHQFHEEIREEAQFANRIFDINYLEEGFIERIARPFQKIINGITNQHRIDDREMPPHAVLGVPVYSLNPYPKNGGIAGSAAGTFCGWLYFYCEQNESINEDLAVELLRLVLPLLDDFAFELLAGAATEAVVEDYRGNELGYNPTEFLRQNSYKFCGWEVLDSPGEPCERGSPFRWKEGTLHLALRAELNGRPEWIAMKGMPTTLLPKDADDADRLGYHLTYHFQTIYRELEYIREVSRVNELEKHKQMMESVLQPLRRLSDALGQMQGDTQELRAIIYEPEEALFASYQLIEPYFRSDHRIQLGMDGREPICIQHAPSMYTDEDLRIVVALVACAVFGKQEDLLKQKDPTCLLAEARFILETTYNRPSTKRLAEDLRWLTDVVDVTDLAHHDTDKARLERALSLIKSALFTPFKVDSKGWPESALLLLCRNEDLKEANLTILDDNKKRHCPPTENFLDDANQRFPSSYATVLTFIRDLATAAAAAGNRITGIQYETGDSSSAFRITFLRQLVSDAERLASELQKVAGKDWRVIGANYGDATRPFILLANRLLYRGNSHPSQQENRPDGVIFEIGNNKGDRSPKFCITIAEIGHSQQITISA